MFYGMPIHIIRDVALTIRSFYKRITDFVRYRHATRDMNERYPDATAAEIGNEDVCIICREAMRPWQMTTEQHGAVVDNATTAAERTINVDERLRPKKLPCGHILHFACLRSWLERQQNCPTCRRPVLTTSSIVHSPNGQPVIQQDRVHGQVNNGNNGAPGQQGNQQANPRANRIRVFNIGPFRLGFGAGQDIQGIAQHLNGQPPQQQLPNHHPTPGVVQQLGFGLRFGRQPQILPQQQGALRPSPQGVQGQLQSVEQQLIQEINDLRMQADQLYLVRALQGELARLRITRAQTNFVLNASIAGDNHNSPGAASVTSMALHTVPTQHSLQVFNVHENQQGPTARSQDLPPGLMLPEGWTLLPLQRFPSGSNSAGQSGTSTHNAVNLPRTSNVYAVPPQAGTTASTPANLVRSQSFPGPLAPDHVGNNLSQQANAGGTTATTAPLELPQPPSGLIPASTSSTGPLLHEPGLNLEAEPSEKGNEIAEISEAPQWGSRPSKSGPHTGVAESDLFAEAETHSVWNDAQPGSSTERRAAKGKGKAPTVEDASEEIE